MHFLHSLILSLKPNNILLTFSFKQRENKINYNPSNNMIALKAIHQTSFTAKNTAFLNKSRLSNNINNNKNSTVCLCSPIEPEPKGNSGPEGDTQKQEILARIAQLQTQKVRLTDYLDERSTYLTQFAEEANTEFDKIGEEALKELDEAGNRIMENVRNKMQEFEAVQEQNRLEIEESENELANLQDQMIKDRNEGLFFQNLRPKTPMNKAEANEETKRVNAVTKEIAESKTRRNIYFGLMGLLVISIVDSLLSSSADWRKLAILGAILVGLIAQVVYEKSLLPKSKEKDDK